MSKKNNLIYYICNYEDISDIEELELIYDDEGFVLEKLINRNITFNCDYPSSLNGNLFYSDIIDKDVISSNKLSNLLDDWFNSYIDDIEGNEDIEDIENEISVENFLEFIFDYAIIKYNKKLKKYFIVKEDIVENCFLQIISNNIDSFFESTKLINLKEIKNFDATYDSFINKIESLVEKETCHLFVSMDGATNDFIITKKDSNLHKELLKNKILPDDEINSKRDFIYEYGFENFKTYFNYFLKKENFSGITLAVHLFNDDEKPELKMFKQYGFFALIKDDNLIIEQLSASEILSSFTKNSLTKEIIEPNKNFIYCGAEKDDVIYGFDLV